MPNGLVSGRTAAFLIALAGVVTVLNLAKGLVDPDGFWHLATGKIIADSGIPNTDPFTFTWAGQPWTAHEWLSELVMFQLHQWWGVAGLTLVWSLFPAATFTVLVVALRRAGLRLAAVAPVAILCALVLTPYVTLRPQAVSWLLLAVLLWILIGVRPRQGPWLLLLGPMFVVWANLHGLYVTGLGVLAVYLVFTFAGRTPMAQGRRWVVLGAAAALLGTIATPAGIAGLLYPLRYLEAGDWGLGYIPEWNTPNFHEPAHLLLLVLIVGIGLTGFRGCPGWLAVLAIASIPASLLAMRSAPVAAVVAMPALAYGAQAWLDRWSRSAVCRVASERPAARLLDLAAALAIVVVAWVALAPADLRASIGAETARRFPVASVDWLEANNPGAHVFAEYSWGGYVAYRLHEVGGADFIDGRNDMFDQAILEDYSAIRAADPGWDEKLTRYGATAILLPPDAPVTHGPATTAGWCEAIRTDREVLLLRDGCPGG
jgi:hypothetical protein